MLFLFCGCKGTTFFCNSQMFSEKIAKNRYFPTFQGKKFGGMGSIF